jgi:hypothetical protein
MILLQNIADIEKDSKQTNCNYFFFQLFDNDTFENDEFDRLY